MCHITFSQFWSAELSSRDMGELISYYENLWHFGACLAICRACLAISTKVPSVFGNLDGSVAQRSAPSTARSEERVRELEASASARAREAAQLRAELDQQLETQTEFVLSIQSEERAKREEYLRRPSPSPACCLVNFDMDD